MALTAGTRLGPYEILSALGAGGMGEVYRARDTKLNRDVALKVIPDTFALDPDRVSRFTREAQVLASLNHPHIAAIYGFEDSGAIHALVLELVEGETLEEKLRKSEGSSLKAEGSGLPLDEALAIARQIAEALEAAHEQGIIHRDLKPANIKITPDGLVKVLDFGLAKLIDPAHAPASDRSLSPTITSPAMMTRLRQGYREAGTAIGVVLGTAAYMSPEQAKGRNADKRSDLWAFGCVLFEMVTGTRPFDGEDVTDVMVAVLSKEPDWTALPAHVPGSIRALIRRCLEKDRRKRVADIAAALFAFDEPASLAPPAGTVSATVPPRRPLWQRVAAQTAATLVVAAVATTLTWVVTRPSDPEAPRVSRLSLAPSGTAALTISGIDRDVAITPDGSRIIYVGNRGTQLFVRALDALEPVAVFTGEPHGLFVSADGEWIGFVDTGNTLKKVAMTGGPAVRLAGLDGVVVGTTWGSDDTIILATTNATTGLQRIAAAGGPTTVLTRPDRAQGEVDHLWPELLPGGRAVLFTITAQTGLDAAQVAVLDLETGTRKILVRGGTHAHYVSSGLGSPPRGEREGGLERRSLGEVGLASPKQGEGGHLVYAAAGTLRAVPFDLTHLATRGTPMTIVSAVVTTSVDAVVAGNGTLAYVLGDGMTGLAAPRTLVWVDRQGRESPIPAPPRAYVYPRLSPDGTRVAVSARDQEQDLWVWDLVRATLTRLTFDPGLDFTPVWTPDGRRLLFASDRSGVQNLYVQAADGTGSTTRLTESANAQAPTWVSADGTQVVFHEVTPTRARDLRLLMLTPTPRVEPLLETPFDDRNGSMSPNGRWLAYESNSAGRYEIYVRPFPNVDAGLWLVSNAGGVQPLWARNGRELFYRTSDGALLTVPVTSHGTTWSAGAATRLVAGRYYTGGNVYTSRQYDVSPDGQRFLMIKEGGGTDQTAAPPQIIVVQHWVEELKRLVPAK